MVRLVNGQRDFRSRANFVAKIHHERASGGRMTRRYFTYTTTVLAALVLSSCGVSVIAGNYNPPQEVKYDSVWNAGWLQISKDSKPLIATSDAPGVCNVGGSQQGCVATDSKLIADFRSFASKLSSSLVPPEFSRKSYVSPVCDREHQGTVRARCRDRFVEFKQVSQKFQPRAQERPETHRESSLAISRAQ